MPPRQRSLPIYPERDRRTEILEELQPIERPHTLLQVARLKRRPPVLVRLDLIRAAKANSGLTNEQIGDIVGVSRYTVAKALNVLPGVDFYTVCEVMSAIGIEMAELFPVQKRKLPERKPMAPTWERAVSREEMRKHEMKLLREQQEIKKLLKSRRRRRG